MCTAAATAGVEVNDDAEKASVIEIDDSAPVCVRSEVAAVAVTSK